MHRPVIINGSLGEGGGQILRASLALSMALSIPFHMINVRANRPKPGLRPQHLACVKAAQSICGATVEGAELDSKELLFQPGDVRSGEYHFDIGSGGSATLLLQAVIPPLLTAEASSTVTVTGGTHVPCSPPYEFLSQCLYPRLETMGPKLSSSLKTVGYMMDGGGVITVKVNPISQLRPLHLEAQSEHIGTDVIIYAHGQPDVVVQHERETLSSDKFAELGISAEAISYANPLLTKSTGNAVLVRTIHSDRTCMIFGEYLQKNRTAQKVAEIAARHALDYVRSGCATDYHLADQLLIPMALAGGGCLTVNKITNHLATCLEIIGSFMDCRHNAAPVGTRNASISFTAVPRTKEAEASIAETISCSEREKPAPWRQWGAELVEDDAVQQMRGACLLPNAVCGALMPDAHKGYGLPIGGVLAVKNAVIPYAVGVDIACRMRLTVLDMPVNMFDNAKRNTLRQALKKETRFGIGAMFTAQERRDHAVMDDDFWDAVEVLRQNKTKAWTQLGTSGKGNHFVEFGELHLEEPSMIGGHKLEAGNYLALLSHSGSRGTGEAVATYYSNIAMQQCYYLPEALRHLSWLDLDTNAGQEYWGAMQLMGRYASANHELIHRHIMRNLGADELTHVENHHNFAWKDKVKGEDVIIHRKGATPAALGVEGIIPGSMASPAFVVRGKGNADALNSCSHGAGRLMSRAAAFQTLNPEDVRAMLKENGVELISGQIDEAPTAYKDIRRIMATQNDLVDVIARFDPKMVIMAPPEGPRSKKRAESINSQW